MGLAVRVIPTLLMRGDQLIKGQRFESWRPVGHPMQAIKVHNARGVDEIILLDIGATANGGPNVEIIRRLADKCFCPLTVGGGVRTAEHVRELLLAGVDKIAFGDALFTAPEVVEHCARRYGSQAFVAALDYKDNGVVRRSNGRVPVVGGVLSWAKRCEEMGVGEILLTNIDSEGTMCSYDYVRIDAVARAVGIPVIAHGGCRGVDDAVIAVKHGASAVAAGALFQFTSMTPRELARGMHAQGIETRIE